eukprot:750391-Hanusia_phi.AAC.7
MNQTTRWCTTCCTPYQSSQNFQPPFKESGGRRRPRRCCARAFCLPLRRLPVRSQVSRAGGAETRDQDRKTQDCARQDGRVGAGIVEGEVESESPSSWKAP